MAWIGISLATGNNLYARRTSLQNIPFKLTKAGQMNFTIPAATPPGKYLLRAEHLAVHLAMNYKGAEMYPACAQIEITGSGTGKL